MCVNLLVDKYGVYKGYLREHEVVTSRRGKVSQKHGTAPRFRENLVREFIEGRRLFHWWK